ncbi:MAG TPA: polyphosphate kinase 1 [Polyangia bacterium]|nr:polyphosphate kinase 1 [Polyangia bacterium]
MDSQDARLFINRELSWLSFNERVLEEACDASLPLFERLKFLTIVSSNLDEFFMVRVAGLKQQLLGGVVEAPADGLLPAEQLAAISERAHTMLADQYRAWRGEILPGLASQGIAIVDPNEMTPEQRTAARAHFSTEVFPALTPLAVDPGHPFPHLRNKSLNIAVIVRKEGGRRRGVQRETLLAVVQVPAMLARLVPLPSASGRAFALLEALTAAYVGDLFPGYAVRQTAPFRVTRNWDLMVDEEDSEDLLSTIQDELRRRDRGAAVRLEIEAAAAPDLVQRLSSVLHLGPADVYPIDGPLQLSDLSGLTDARPELRVDPLVPVVPPLLRQSDSMVGVIARQDVLLHHPYESFDPVLRFIEEAASDPAVLAIKQTLYRTSGDSPIVAALYRAAENGKQVTVLVEIKARFDEANNIAWARRLEENGVHVVYGLIGLKTHCKAALVVRREGSGIRRYVHLGTGNYNPQTARQYTDLSLLTARPEIADDVTALFNVLTGYAEPPQWKRLAVAPFGLQERIVLLIEREAQRARAGEPARIIAKMNALVDPLAIRALYAASQAGVEIDLLVRGICCLRPGLEGVSERIRVTSIVDRFLEHSRVFAFGAGDRTEVFLSSADWMPRNFVRRIEALFPVEDPAVRQRLLEEVLGLALSDNVKARRLQVDGSYSRIRANGAAEIRSQIMMLDAARRAGIPKIPAEPVIRHAAAPEPPTESQVRRAGA